jgi:glycosyltransferase involved in cell wall biosynthesis
MVLDNGSTDGTAEWLATQPDIDAVLLEKNIGHGAALDHAFLRATTEYVAVLDVDAYPISPDWLAVPKRLLEQGATVAGAEFGNLPLGRTPHI